MGSFADFGARVGQDIKALMEGKAPSIHAHPVGDLQTTGGTEGQVPTIVGTDVVWQEPPAGVGEHTHPIGEVDGLQADLDAKAAQIRALDVRGENLVTNGSGELGDTTNFTSVTNAPERAPMGYPSAFQVAAANTQYTVLTTDAIPVNPAESYRQSAMLMGKAGMRHRLAIASYDVDGLLFFLQYANRLASSQTTLAADLVDGAKTLTLADGTGWPASGGATSHLAHWPYVNGLGQTFNPEDGYTRNVSALGSFTRSGNTVTFATAWAGGTVPAGKVVTLNYSGASYIYPRNVIAAADEELFVGTIGGMGNGLHGQQEGKFWPGTAMVRIGLVINVGALVNDPTIPAFTGLRFVNDTARQEKIALPRIATTGATEGQVLKIVGGVPTWVNP